VDALRGIERTVELPVTPEELWVALTRPEQLSTWFGADVLELELRAGGRVALVDRDSTIRRGLVQEVERPHRFSFRWLPIAEGPEGFSGALPATWVEFTLEEREGGTRLTVRETASPFGGEAAGTSPRVLVSA
jgi:uncharacterized protein YndB with AHSA1/START domain